MKVIVAGFPKTGTKSMHAALERLGFSVYDSFENCCILSDEYSKIANEGWTHEDFRGMYENVDATMDFPACFFWEEISRAFPDAKIVLTVRDDEEAWLKSFLKQLEMMDGSLSYRMMEWLSPTTRKATRWITQLHAPAFGTQLRTQFGGTVRGLNTSLMKKAYRSHNAYVKQNAPKDKLLVYKISEGWESLCKFLDVPIPDEPFPHKNKGGNILNEEETKNLPLIKKLRNEVIFSVVKITAVTAVTGICLYKIGVPRIANALYGCIESWRGGCS